MKNKFNHTINWNYIFTLFAIVTLIVVFFPNWNEKKEKLLETELEIIQRENENLKKEIDPEWHQRFNNQKEFYSSILSQKDSALSKVSKKADSLKTISKSKIIIKSQADSILFQENLSYKKCINYYRRLIAEVDSVLDADSASMVARDKLIDSQDRLLNEYSKETGYSGNYFRIYILAIFAITFLLLGYIYTLIKKKWNKKD